MTDLEDRVTANISREHHALAFLCHAPAWEGLYKARVAEQVSAMYNLLLNPSRSRKEAQPDDFIRGYIAALRWAVTWPETELNLAAQRAIDEVVEAPEVEEPVVGGSRPPAEEETS